MPIWFAVVSTLASLYFQQQETKAQERIAEKNQEMALQEAQAAQEANKLESEQFRRRAKAFLSTQRAKAGAIDVSSREVLSASERGFEADAEIIRQRGLAAYNQQINRAELFGIEKRSIGQTGRYRQARTILGGARSAYGTS